MRALLDDDQIAAVGVSNYSLSRWRKADAAQGRPLISSHVQFSLAHPGPLQDLVPFAERENRMVMAHNPLAPGLLGGKYSVDHRPGGVQALNPLFGRENLQRAAPLLDMLCQVADAFDAKPAQVAWTGPLRVPRVVVIPGALSVQQLEVSVAAGRFDHLARAQRLQPHGQGSADERMVVDQDGEAAALLGGGLGHYGGVPSACSQFGGGPGRDRCGFGTPGAGITGGAATSG